MQNLSIEQFSPKKAELVALVEKHKGLTIAGPEDKEGYAAVRAARIALKTARVEVQKKAKDLRSEAVKFQKGVLSLEKELVGIIEPTEKEYQQMELEIDDHFERLKEEEEKKKKEAIDKRISTLFAYGMRFDGQIYSYGELSLTLEVLEAMTDDRFAEFAGKVQEAFHAEQERIKAEEKARKEEADRLEKQRLEQAAHQKKLDDEKAKLEAEKLKVEAEKKRIQEEKDAAEREKQKQIE